jgi:glutathione S-transferase
MRLFNSVGPNPHVVRMFLAEKGLTIPLVEVDIRGGENRRADYLAINPAGQTPALDLGTGQIVTEITAICEYLEEVHPSPALIGTNAAERAETRSWARRIDLNILEPLANGFRYSEGLPMFKDRMHCIPVAADDLKAIAREHLVWLNHKMAGKSFICGERFSLADILLFAFLTFGAVVGQPLDQANTNLVAWMARVGARPSAKA